MKSLMIPSVWPSSRHPILRETCVRWSAFTGIDPVMRGRKHGGRDLRELGKPFLPLVNLPYFQQCYSEPVKVWTQYYKGFWQKIMCKQGCNLNANTKNMRMQKQSTTKSSIYISTSKSTISFTSMNISPVQSWSLYLGMISRNFIPTNEYQMRRIRKVQHFIYFCSNEQQKFCQFWI